jgi:hypothetical protein
LVTTGLVAVLAEVAPLEADVPPCKGLVTPVLPPASTVFGTLKADPLF